jgi:hypothetical protein
VTPALRLGRFIAFVTTMASKVAVINSIVAGAGVALLAGHRLGAARMEQALGLGVSGTVALMATFFIYQRWRFSLSLAPIPMRPKRMDRNPIAGEDEPDDPKPRPA